MCCNKNLFHGSYYQTCQKQMTKMICCDINITAVVFNLSILVKINWFDSSCFSKASTVFFLIIFSFLFSSIANIDSVASFPQLLQLREGSNGACLSKLVMHVSIYEFFLILFLVMHFQISELVYQKNNLKEKR